MAWQASSKRRRLCLSQSAFKDFKSAMEPHICTGITTFVFGVMALSTADGFKVKVSSTSTKIGTAPIAKTDSKLATKVNVGRITSSPAPTPALAKATVKAAVPLLTTCAWFTCILAHKAASSSLAFQCPLRAPSNP